MRRVRRAKQREDNIKRAAKMHSARLRVGTKPPAGPPQLKQSIHVGCSLEVLEMAGLVLCRCAPALADFNGDSAVMAFRQTSL
jgi:hypothetical protein